jgi:hypothetical protein
MHFSQKSAAPKRKIAKKIRIIRLDCTAYYRTAQKFFRIGVDMISYLGRM